LEITRGGFQTKEYELLKENLEAAFAARTYPAPDCFKVAEAGTRHPPRRNEAHYGNYVVDYGSFALIARAPVRTRAGAAPCPGTRKSHVPG
jgi:hypothetical protein